MQQPYQGALQGKHQKRESPEGDPIKLGE